MEILESCSGRIPEMDTQNGRVCKTWGKKNLNIRHVRNSFFYLIISLSAGCKNLFCFNNQPVREGFHLQSGTVGKRWYLDAVFSHLMYHYVFHQARARPQIVKESRHSRASVYQINPAGFQETPCIFPPSMLCSY